ncbi:helix-turn-helix transcriptional regulator [Microbacterium esteraromaticum]|uniref:helix-turn-helix transcriptional regulator n=1 Tax=Microbacterium esteraromaticum TaxID=57043 RepID=UPI000B361565|nr:helix-turn-helix domain-containing protein [Microbacterium esteraromaticum]
MSKTTDTPLWYTTEELAALMRVDRSTISRRLKDGTFPLTPLVLGSRRLWAVQDVHQLAGLTVEH